MSVRVLGTYGQDHIDEKRFSLGGCRIESDCPKCGVVSIKDYYLSYPETNLSYPETNMPIDLGFYCYDCSAEWDVQIIVRISI
jgi:hypothetical protein